MTTPTPPDPTQCSMQLAGGPTNTNNPVNFFVIARQSSGVQLTRGGTVFSISYTGPVGATITNSGSTPSDNGDGTYSGWFESDTVGTVVATVNLISDPDYTGPSPVQISGSPYSYPIDGPYAPNCTANVPATAPHGVVCSFNIQSVDQFGTNITTGNDPFVVDIRGSKKHKPKKYTKTDNGDGTYTVTFTPHTAGHSDIIKITLLGVNISGSKFTVVIT